MEGYLGIIGLLSESHASAPRGVLSALREAGDAPRDLCGKVLRVAHIRHVYEAVDQRDAMDGKHTVFLGSSVAVMQGTRHTGERAELPPTTPDAAHRRHGELT
jgi:hypothetical protein